MFWTRFGGGRGGFDIDDVLPGWKPFCQVLHAC